MGWYPLGYHDIYVPYTMPGKLTPTAFPTAPNPQVLRLKYSPQPKTLSRAAISKVKRNCEARARWIGLDLLGFPRKTRDSCIGRY